MSALSAKSNAFMASTSFASAKRQAPVQRGSLQVGRFPLNWDFNHISRIRIWV